MFNLNRRALLITILLVLLGIWLRVLPHPPNVAPITGIALLSGAKLPFGLSLTLPLLIMIISDLVIGMHSLIVITWGSFLIIALIGGYFLRQKFNLGRLFIITLSSSFLFFVVTNFGVWLEGRLYPHTLQGLIQCFTMAIPFYRNTILGDLIFTGAFFGAYEILISSAKLVGQKFRLHIFKV